jgi:REP element-mobilizing transposase RayT
MHFSLQKKNMPRKRFNRRSIRLKGFDFSQRGTYFITLNCIDRKHLFGKISDAKMHLNPWGTIAHNCWLEIPQNFPNVKLHAFVIMPDHTHGLLEITDDSYKFSRNTKVQKPEESCFYAPIWGNKNWKVAGFESPVKTIGSIIRSYKIGVTKGVRKENPNAIVWQRDYYAHIVLDEKAFQNITRYIDENPLKW